MKRKSSSKGEWVRDTSTPVVQIHIDANICYKDLVKLLKEELGVKSACILLNSTGAVIEEQEFSFVRYIIEQKKYVGRTRLYLGISPAAIKSKEIGDVLVDVSLSDVKEYLREKDKARTAVDPTYEMCDATKYSPENDSAKVRLFMAQYNAKFDRKLTPFGTFYMVPWSVVDTYSKFELKEGCHLVELPLIHYLNQHGEAARTSHFIAEDVIQFSGVHSQQYTEWLGDLDWQ